MSFPDFEGFKNSCKYRFKYYSDLFSLMFRCLTFSAYLPALTVHFCYDTSLLFLCDFILLMDPL